MYFTSGSFWQQQVQEGPLYLVEAVPNGSAWLVQGGAQRAAFGCQG